MPADKPTRFYVAARRNDGAGSLTRYLVGPFATRRAALAMCHPVRLAIRRLYPDDERYHLSSIEAVETIRNKPGTLNLFDAVDDLWIDHLLNYGKGKSSTR